MGNKEKIDEAIAEMFGPEPTEERTCDSVDTLADSREENLPEVREPAQAPTTQSETETYIKQKIVDAIKDGENALTDLMGLAKQLQHPQAYEAIGKLIKQITDSAVALSKIKVETRTDETPAAPKKQTNIQNNITNVVVKGTLSEVLNGIKPKE